MATSPSQITMHYEPLHKQDQSVGAQGLKSNMKQYDKTLPPEDQQIALSERERNHAISKEICEFNNRKKIIITNLPGDFDCDKKDSALLRGYHVTQIQVERNSADNSSTATVTVGNGEEARKAIDQINGCLYRSRNLKSKLAPIDSMLCLTNLPLTYKQEEVRKLAEQHGAVDRAFLVVSDESGLSKGYAFVEYANKDTARKAKTLLNGHRIQSHTLTCDWADEQHSRWEKLHSTCLLAELSQDFTDQTKFRSLFNKIAEPRYIQLALNKDTGKCLGFGIVAFESADQTEKSWLRVNGMNVQGQCIRVFFICPGHSGRNEYTRRLGRISKQPSSPTSMMGASFFPSPNTGLMGSILINKPTVPSGPSFASAQPTVSPYNSISQQAALGILTQPSPISQIPQHQYNLASPQMRLAMFQNQLKDQNQINALIKDPLTLPQLQQLGTIDQSQLLANRAAWLPATNLAAVTKAAAANQQRLSQNSSPGGDSTSSQANTVNPANAVYKPQAQQLLTTPRPESLTKEDLMSSQLNNPISGVIDYNGYQQHLQQYYNTLGLQQAAYTPVPIDLTYASMYNGMLLPQQTAELGNDLTERANLASLQNQYMHLMNKQALGVYPAGLPVAQTDLTTAVLASQLRPTAELA